MYTKIYHTLFFGCKSIANMLMFNNLHVSIFSNGLTVIFQLIGKFVHISGFFWDSLKQYEQSSKKS